MSQQIMEKVEASSLKSDVDTFNIGDTVDVHTRILEGEKERIQVFNGVVIARSGTGTREMFTVRRIVAGEGVERKFPVHSPKIAKVVVRSGEAHGARGWRTPKKDCGFCRRVFKLADCVCRIS
ncbi:MAG: 50S ribosomal protein L19 [Pirellulales bacterium]